MTSRVLASLSIDKIVLVVVVVVLIYIVMESGSLGALVSSLVIQLEEMKNSSYFAYNLCDII